VNNIEKILVLTFVIFIIGCAGQMTPIPDMNSKDAKLYSDKCSPCHSLPHPKRHTAKQWEHILVTMDKEIKQKEMSPLTVDERKNILNYIKKHAR